jgi:hypothetical protein
VAPFGVALGFLPSAPCQIFQWSWILTTSKLQPLQCFFWFLVKFILFFCWIVLCSECDPYPNRSARDSAWSATKCFSEMRSRAA